MLYEIMSFIDDILIDVAFQPSCNFFRTHFGVPKFVLGGICGVLSSISALPLATLIFLHTGSAGTVVGLIIYSALTILFAASLDKVYFGIRNTKNHSNNTGTCEVRRLTHAVDRKLLLLTSVSIAFPFCVFLAFIPETSIEGMTYIVSACAHICSEYYFACTDLPRGKTTYSRVREWIFTQLLEPMGRNG